MRRFLESENGTTAIEYGIIAASISVFIIVSVSTVGGNVSTLFETMAKELGGKCC